MAERIYLNVISDFDRTGFMRPRAIHWEDGRVFKIEAVKDYRPASFFGKGMRGDCYTVVIKGETRYLFFERIGDMFTTRVGRWYVVKEK